jgi:hypothetical protein
LYIIEIRDGSLFIVMVSCHAYSVYTCGGGSVNENSLISGSGHGGSMNLRLIIAASWFVNMVSFPSIIATEYTASVERK